MVIFDPKFTEIIYLDTESYVPLEDREKSHASMIVNPSNPNHFFLGGVSKESFHSKTKKTDSSIFGDGRKAKKRPLCRRSMIISKIHGKPCMARHRKTLI
jgi:hypothetical protein